jgi:hypothetical protein
MIRSGYGRFRGCEDQVGRGWSDVSICGILFENSESERGGASPAAESFVPPQSLSRGDHEAEGFTGPTVGAVQLVRTSFVPQGAETRS